MSDHTSGRQPRILYHDTVLQPDRLRAFARKVAAEVNGRLPARVFSGSVSGALASVRGWEVGRIVEERIVEILLDRSGRTRTWSIERGWALLLTTDGLLMSGDYTLCRGEDPADEAEWAITPADDARLEWLDRPNRGRDVDVTARHRRGRAELLSPTELSKKYDITVHARGVGASKALSALRARAGS